jgi:macrodomain Ter protein organizer (MatP/YcbG family)
MSSHATTAEHLNTQTIELPINVAVRLKAQARVHRKTITEFIQEWLDDQDDAVESARRLADLKSGKTKTVAWATAKQELMNAP